MYPLNTNQQIHKLKSEIISYQNRIRIFKIYIYIIEEHLSVLPINRKMH